MCYKDNIGSNEKERSKIVENTNSKISIITPVYNSEKYIENTRYC